MANELAVAYVSLAVSGQGLRKQVESELGGVAAAGDKAGKSLGERVSSGFKTAAKVGLAAAGAVAATALAKGFGRLKSIEEAQAKMRGLGHDSATVTKIMDNALASVRGTAFGLGEAATTAAGAVAAGIKPGEQLEGVLKSVANSAAAAGVGMDEMGSIYNKVASLGKAQNDVLQQVADRGIPIYKALADNLGVTTEEVFKMASAGKIGFAEFEEAMTSASGTVAEEMGKTFSGSLSNLWASLGRVGANLMGGVFDKLAPGAQGLTEQIGKLEPVAKKVGEAIGSFVDKAFTGFQGVYDLIVKGDFSSSLRDAFGLEEDSGLVSFLLNVRDVATTVFGEVSGGIKAFVGAWKAGDGDITSSGFPGFMERVAGIARQVFDFFQTKGVPAFQKVADVVRDRIIPAVSKFIDGLRENLWPIIQNVAHFFEDKVLPAFRLVAGFIMDTLVPAAADIGATVAETVLPIVDKLVEVFRQHIQPALLKVAGIIMDKVVPFLVRLAEVIVPVVKWLVEMASKIIKFVVPIILDLAGRVFGFLMDKAGWLLSKIMDVFNGIFDVIAKVVGWIKDTAWPKYIKPAFEAIAAGASTMWDGIKKVFGWLKDGVDGVRKAFGAAKDGIARVWGGLKDAVSGPIRAALDWVNKYFIDPINSLLGKLGISFRISRINTSGGGAKGTSTRGGPLMAFAGGGRVPGYSPSPTADNILARLTAGEFVLPVGATSSLMRQVGAGGMEMLRRGILPQFASGGFVGWIKKRGTDAIDLASSIGKVLMNPLGALKDFAAKALGGLAGGPFAQALKGAMLKAVEGIASKITAFGGEDVSGRGSGAMSWQSIWALIKAVAPESRMTSNYRPGAITASGFPSKHGQGRAVDLVSPNMMATFNKIRGLRAWTELYYSPAEWRQLLNGRSHRPTGITRAMHFNHIHAAMAHGGLVKPLLFDSGGVLPRGISLVSNQTGKPEPLKRVDGEGPKLVQHINVQYPQAEPTSVTVARSMQFAAGIGTI